METYFYISAIFVICLIIGLIYIVCNRKKMNESVFVILLFGIISCIIVFTGMSMTFGFFVR